MWVCDLCIYIIKPNYKPVLIHMPLAPESVRVQIGCEDFAVRHKSGNGLKGSRIGTFRKPSVILHIDMTVLTLFVLSDQHVPCRHMAYAVRVCNLGVHAALGDDTVKQFAFYSSAEGNHFNMSDRTVCIDDMFLVNLYENFHD